MRTLAAATAALVFALPATAANTPADYAQATLRDGCAQSHASYSAHLSSLTTGTPAPAFTGERIKGDNRYYNDAKACDAAQYAVYLEKADPGTVAMAYPTAAGKAKVTARKPVAAVPVSAKPK